MLCIYDVLIFVACENFINDSNDSLTTFNKMAEIILGRVYPSIYKLKINMFLSRLRTAD